MKIERSISIVKGYHNCTRIPEAAVNEGLKYRLAIVLDTYRRDKVDMFFDEELYFKIIFRICDLIKPDQIKVFTIDDKILDSLEAMKNNILSLEDEHEPPKEIHFFKDGKINSCIYTEYWTFAGGPMPYSDSYTISVYTKDDISNELIVICDDVCNELNATITSFIEASSVPIVKHKIFNRLLKKIFRRNRRD